MPKKTLIISVSGIVVLVLLSYFLMYASRKADKNTDPENSGISIRAENLLTEFQADEQNANSLYLDKIIEVTGRIDSYITDNSFHTVTLKEPGATAGVICSFSAETVDPAGFIPGEILVAKGQCTGYLFDVILVRCKIEN